MTEPITTHDAHGASFPQQTKQVYVIDDDVQIRRSLHFMLSAAGYVCWPFASASDFIDGVMSLEPAPILLDVRMPEVSGIELMSMLVKRGITWPVIFMSAHADIQIAVQGIKLGALDFIEKPFEFDVLETTLQAAMTQLSLAKETMQARQSSHHLFDLLSPREIEVLLILMHGLPNKRAADQLSLSTRTIEMHRAHALAKLGVRSIAEVIRLATDAGITLTSHK